MGKLSNEFLQKLSDDLLKVCDFSAQLYLAQLVNAKDADKPEDKEIANFILIKEIAKDKIKLFAQELPQIVQQQFDTEYGENPNNKDSDELFEMLKNRKGYNPVLGTPDDPQYDSYKEFLKQIGGGGEPPES